LFVATVSENYNLAILYPKVAKQWHPTKNGNLRPKDVVPQTGRKVWWKCSEGVDHEWETSCGIIVGNFIKGKGETVGCPFCRGLRASVTNCLANYPEVAEQWHPIKNDDLTPNDVTYGTSKKYWWKCPKAKDHEWMASPEERTGRSKTGCPFCSGYKVAESNSLATIHPDWVAQWDYSKNGKLSPETLYAKSGKKIWWKCDKGPDHKWKTSPAGRHQSDGAISGCPCCANRKLSVTNSLKTVRPDLAKEWHPTKNKIQPHELMVGSNQIVWWKCPKGPDHEWKTRPAQRVSSGSGCPCCRGLKVSVTNCLETIGPHVIDTWHPTKNALVTPKDIVAKTHKKYWWKCPEGPDHEWQVSPDQILRYFDDSGKNGCPFCDGKRVSVTNSLATRFPDVAESWHPIKNGDLKPTDVVGGGQKKVWWKCSRNPNHEWEQKIENVTTVWKRRKRNGCPVCFRQDNLKRLEGLVLDKLEDGSLQILYPEVASLWHPEKNGEKTPTDVTPHSNKKVWWKCPEGPDHEWRTSPDSIVRQGMDWGGNGCPYCSNYRLSVTNNLAVRYPQIAKLWHPENNKTLTPETVIAGSHVKRWWVCPEGPDHEWATNVQQMIRSFEMFGTNGCPYCRGLKVSVTNNLQKIYPEIAKEWHPTKNKNLTPEKVVAGTNRKVWWQCQAKKEHTWYVSPSARRQYEDHFSGCPECNILPRSQPEIYLAFEIQKYIDFDMEKHKIKTIGKLLDVDIVIESLKLCIEFDGSRWHKEKTEKDKAKTDLLEKNGWKVIRVREKPLEITAKNDILVPIQRTGRHKAMTNKVLKKIEKVCEITIDGLDEYLRRKDPVNHKAAKAYITKLLRDKDQTTLDVA